MHLNPKIFREYDIRGQAEVDLTPEVAQALGQVFGTLILNRKGKSVCVGYDGRLSSPALEESLILGLSRTGVSVKRIGRGPSPLLYFAHHIYQTDGAIMVTGSHNPPQDNGFKMIVGTSSVYGAAIQELARRITQETWALADTPGRIEERPTLDAYVAYLLQDFQTYYEGRGRSLKVAWDPGNGAGGEVLPALLKNLPGHHILINEKVDGHFPNHPPDPTLPENLGQLCEVVLQEKCDLGVAFDGDADRLGVVDNTGHCLWGDQFMLLFAEEILKTAPGAQIIADIKASQLFFDQVRQLGGRPCMWRTGHSLIKTKMRETKAPLAGEMSGHIFFNDRYFGYDDGIYAALRLLGICSQSDISLSQWRTSLPLVFNTPEIRLPCDHLDKFQVIQKVVQALIDQKQPFSDLDGVRVQHTDGWWLIRASHTQEALVIRVEATSEPRLFQLKQEVATYLQKGGVELKAA